MVYLPFIRYFWICDSMRWVTFLVSVADFIGVFIASASHIVRDVSRAIARLYTNFVVIQNDTQQEFYNIAGFPRVHDGTHILIQSPNSIKGEEYRNRKGTLIYLLMCKLYATSIALKACQLNPLTTTARIEM